MRSGAGCGLWMTVALLTVPAALADDADPGRGVARISVINGDVSVRRGDSGDWVAAAVNAPLVVQDTIATGPGSRAEVQFDYANMLRLASNTEVRLSELEYRRYQVQVARGTVEFRVLRNSDADVEVSTPAVSVRPSKRGAYRVTVREDGETEITARSGEVEVYTPRGVEYVKSGRTMLARSDSGGPEYQMVSAVEYDEFDRWNEQRDRVLERSGSYRYVSPSIYGADDLDGYGRWVYDAPLGWVWVPGVSPGWAPYRNGRWAWVDWYGWSWVSYDPWGWAPFHYGRWYWGNHGWCWYPGAFGARYYWSPGLVAFFGFGTGGSRIGVGFGFGHVGWVPLAPHEPYYPWYGRHYYRSGGYIDRSINITNINVTNVYRNSRHGISGVDAGRFGRGGGVARVSYDEVRHAGLVRGQLPMAPSNESVRFGDRQVRHVPRGIGNERFYSRRPAAAVERISFAEQQRRFQTPAAGVSPAAGSWRRTATAAPRSEVPAQRSMERTRDTGWRHAGGESQPGMVRPVERQTPRVGEDVRWRRFGEPAAAGQSAGAAPQRRSGASVSMPQRAVERGSGPESRWRRFGEPGSARQAQPSVQRLERSPRSMQIAPPVIRERSMPRVERSMPMERTVPRVERSMPAERSTPRMERRMPQVERSSPRMERSAPMPRVERSAPRVERSAPRVESRGGGGSQAAHGGGQSSGRGGGRRR